MGNKLAYSPAQCPIDVETLLRHSIVDDPTDEDLVLARGAAATELVEQHLGRLLLARSVSWTVSADERGAHPLSGPAFGRSCPAGYGVLSGLGPPSRSPASSCATGTAPKRRWHPASTTSPTWTANRPAYV